MNYESEKERVLSKLSSWVYEHPELKGTDEYQEVALNLELLKHTPADAIGWFEADLPITL